MTRLALFMTAALFAAPPALAQTAAKGNPSAPVTRGELDKLIRDYLITNPEVLIEATKALETKQEAERVAKLNAGVSTNLKALRESPEGTVMGNPKGDLTVVEFFDYNCSACKAIFPALLEAVRADGKVRLVMKELPFLTASSETATRAAIASVKQGKYTAFHTALMTHKGALGDETIMTIAKDAGLDVARLQADMKAAAVDKAIESNDTLFRDLLFDGTPSLIVGESVVSKPVETAQDGGLKALFAKARAKS